MATPFHFGRFAIQPPGQVALRGRAQSMVHLPIRTEQLDPGATIADVRKRSLARILALKAPTGMSSALWREESPRSDMWFVFYHDEPQSPRWIRMEAVRVAGSMSYTIRGKNTLDRESALRDYAIRIASAITSTKAPDPSEPGFAIDRGVVNLPFEYQESAEAVFDLPGKVTLALDSHSNAKVLPRALLAEKDAALGRLAAVGVHLRTVREGPRVLAGLAGEELVLTSDQGEQILFQWQYVGQQMSGEHPNLDIQLEVPGGAREPSWFATWDAMLATLRRRP